MKTDIDHTLLNVLLHKLSYGPDKTVGSLNDWIPIYNYPLLKFYWQFLIMLNEGIKQILRIANLWILEHGSFGSPYKLYNNNNNMRVWMGGGLEFSNQ